MKKIFMLSISSKILPGSPEIVNKYANTEYAVGINKSMITRAGWKESDFTGLINIDISDADIVLTTEPLPIDVVKQLKQKSVVIGSLDPYWNKDITRVLSDRCITSFALDLIVRSTKAQYMDVVSSQANLAGYRAIIEAVSKLNRSLPLMITTAGTLPSAKVLVIGAGVAGLQAIATAKRLGANVYAFDVRSSAKEQVESLGAKFIEISNQQQYGVYANEVNETYKIAQKEALQKILPDIDIVVTTAQIPGKQSPIILTKDLLYLMKHDAVVVDITAKHGGNCEVLPTDDPIILRFDNILNNIPKSASMLYAKNVFNFIKYVEPFLNDNLDDTDDEIIKSTLLTYNGKVIHKLFTDIY